MFCLGAATTEERAANVTYPCLLLGAMDSLLDFEGLQVRANAESTGSSIRGGLCGTAGSHCRRIYELLRETVQQEWKNIPDPTSEDWLNDVRLRIAEKQPLNNVNLKTRTSVPSRECSNAAAMQQESSEKEHGATFEDFSPQEEFLLLSKVLNRVDIPWAQALKRLRAIEECEKSRPLEITEVLNYSRRLAGSVAAPPETRNTVDVVAHQSAFPAYHFLPYPSMEELQNSRLAALGAKPYASVCFPPEVTARAVYLRRDAAFSLQKSSEGLIPAFDTTLVSNDLWLSDDARLVVYELRFTCPTPCCTFWFAVANGHFSGSKPFPQECPVRELRNSRPLLVPGPFPKTVRVQCRKQGKKQSRFTQTCLKLEGTAVAWATLPTSEPPVGELRDACGDQSRTKNSAPAAEAGLADDTKATSLPVGAETSGVSQFHGLMLGAARQRRQQRRQNRSSESSSGSSSDGG